MSNNPITKNDIDLVESIFGKDVSAIKGETTRKKPLPVVENEIEIPQELVQRQRNTLCIDGMMVNSIHFLSTISRNIYY